VILYRQEDRARGFGREAVELLTAWLFTSAGAERVQAGTEVGNGAMRAVLEHLGFRLEGVMRSCGATSDGTRLDGAMYALIKSDWIAARREQE